MNHLDKYILVERKRILNEGMFDDAKKWIKKFGKDNIPSLFGYSKGEKVRISKFGRMSEINSAPSNAATLKEVFESYFSEKNKPLLRKKYADKMFGTGRGFDKMMTEPRREWYLKKLQSEYGTIQRVIHNRIWNKEDQKIKYFKSSILDRGSAIYGGAGGIALFGAVLVGGPAALGIADYFDDTDENVDEDDILEYAEKVIKEALEDIEKQFSGDEKQKRKAAASFDDSDINDRLTEFLAEELAERYRMWFLKDPKGRQGVAKRDGQTTVSWRGSSNAPKAAAKKKKTDAAATAATATTATATAAAPKLDLSNTSKPSWWDGANMPDDEKLIGKENHYMTALWTPVKNKLGSHKAAAKRTNLAAFNTKRAKAMKMPGGDERTKKLHDIIDARIKEMEGYYATIVGGKPGSSGPAVAATSAPAKAKVKVSSGGGSTSSQNAMLAKTSHKNLAGLQSYLMGAGFYDKKLEDTTTFKSGKADGRYGPETRSAIKNLQKELGVKADGVYGPKTDAEFRKKPEVQGANSVVAAAAEKKPASGDIASLKKAFNAAADEATRLATGVGASDPRYKAAEKKMRLAQAALQTAQAKALEEIIRQETNALLKERGMA